MVNESVKISYLLTMIYPPCIGFLQYLNINEEAFTILGVLLMMDFVIGMAKSYVIAKKITHTRAVAGIISKIIILIIPIALGLMFAALVDTADLHIDKYLSFVISALVVAETYSIMENFYTIRTKNEPKHVDLVSFVIRGIRTFLEKLLQGFKI